MNLKVIKELLDVKLTDPNDQKASADAKVLAIYNAQLTLLRALRDVDASYGLVYTDYTVPATKVLQLPANFMSSILLCARNSGEDGPEIRIENKKTYERVSNSAFMVGNELHFQEQPADTVRLYYHAVPCTLFLGKSATSSASILKLDPATILGWIEGGNDAYVGAVLLVNKKNTSYWERAHVKSCDILALSFTLDSNLSFTPEDGQEILTDLSVPAQFSGELTKLAVAELTGDEGLAANVRARATNDGLRTIQHTPTNRKL